MSAQVVQIYNEFNNAVTALKQKKLDVLDLKDASFGEIVGAFDEKIADLDKRIA